MARGQGVKSGDGRGTKRARTGEGVKETSGHRKGAAKPGRGRSVRLLVLAVLAIGTVAAILATKKLHHRVTARVMDVTVLATWGSAGEDKGGFRRAYFLAADKSGNSYVYDIETYRLQKFNAKGEFVQSVALESAASQKFQGAGAIACDPDGNVLLNEPSTGSVIRFSPDGKLLSRFKHGFYGQRGLAIDSNGIIYVTDTGNQRVCKFDPSGNFLVAWGTRGSAKGAFTEPIGIACDEQGRVHVVDTGNHRIQTFEASGKHVSSFHYASGGDGGYPIDPYLAYDGHGHLVMTDSHNQRLQFFDLEGKNLRCTKGNVVQSPAGVACTADGAVLVTDKNHRVQKIAPVGDLAR